MTVCAERLRRILAEPLDYLHPQRLDVPPGFDSPDARRVLNRILLEGLVQHGPWPPLTLVAQQWIRQWQQLPDIARLMGAWRLFPQLARGAALQQLPRRLRQFATCRPGLRASLPLEPSALPLQQVEAAGFNALSSFSGFLPPSLFERLPLQFSPHVVDLHAQWPVADPDTTLFFLAVQHARLHPNPD